MSSRTLRDVALRAPGKLGRPFWESAYASLLSFVDAVVIVAASLLALALRVGEVNSDLTLGSAHPQLISYSALIALMAPAWVAILAASRCYEARYLGVGSEEFKRVVNGSVRFVALLGFTAFATKAQIARGFVAIVVPLGISMLLVSRYAIRKGLHTLRSRGMCLHRVVVVGSPEEVLALTKQVEREPYAGLHVVAAALPDYLDVHVTHDGRELPNIGPARWMVPKLAALGVDTVAVAGPSAMSSNELRQLSWDLEGTGTDLVVAPAITDVTGPRIHIRPVAGLPLLHVEAPVFAGPARVLKRAIDLVGALVLLIILGLPLIVVTLLVRREDGGPAFYRQVRVGRGATRFRIWKFRSMTVGADDQLAGLADRNESDGPLFKLRQDPRVTKIGARLRKYSFDELPQLLNVLAGTMSLVGPRPPLPSEVDVYAEHVHRRLLVKPGMTGLWQVSGRADLAWEESVRLDLYYVENWSVALDVQILWKTAFAVFFGRGAY